MHFWFFTVEFFRAFCSVFSMMILCFCKCDGNFMYQIKGWFWMRLIFKLVKIEKNRLFSVMTVEHIQSVEGLNRTKDRLSRVRRKFPAFQPLDWNIGSTLPLAYQTFFSQGFQRKITNYICFIYIYKQQQILCIYI